MIPPAKRIWLYPDRTFTRPRDLEIIILGEPEAIAPLVVDVRALLHTWPGFENVHPIVMGDQAIGFRASRSKHATHDEPLAEAMLMLRGHRIEWTGGDPGWAGIVGTW
jgi:hypothetical protein